MLANCYHETGPRSIHWTHWVNWYNPCTTLKLNNWLHLCFWPFCLRQTLTPSCPYSLFLLFRVTTVDWLRVGHLPSPIIAAKRSGFILAPRHSLLLAHIGSGALLPTVTVWHEVCKLLTCSSNVWAKTKLVQSRVVWPRLYALGIMNVDFSGPYDFPLAPFHKSKATSKRNPCSKRWCAC